MEFVVNLDGKSLKAGRNDFNIFIKYKDGNDNNYESSASLDVNLVNVTLWQKVQIAFLQFNQSLVNVSVKNAIMLIVGIGIVFILVVWFVFRKK